MSAITTRPDRAPHTPQRAPLGRRQTLAIVAVGYLAAAGVVAATLLVPAV